MADSMTNTEMLLAYIETILEGDLSNRAPAKEELMEDQPVPITPNPRKASFQIPEVTYPAEAFKAFCGKNDAMVYHFGDKCYSFMFKRANKNRTSVYICSGCKQNKSSKEVRITLYGGRFMENPLKIPHVCQPVIWAAEVATRKVYETTQKLKHLYGKMTPKEAFDRLKDEILSDESYSKEDRQAVVDKLGAFESCRKPFSQTLNMLKLDGPEAKDEDAIVPSLSEKQEESIENGDEELGQLEIKADSKEEDRC